MIDLSRGRVIGAETEAEKQARRRLTLGASEVAAACGLSPWMTPIELWQEKCGFVPPRESNLAMEIGLYMEQKIKQLFERRTGKTVRHAQMQFTHPHYSWLTATVDGIVDDDELVEYKSVGELVKDWGDDGSEDIPETYLVQAEMQMACSGAARNSVAVLIGKSRFQIHPAVKDDCIIAGLIDRAREFRACVESREPPTWGALDARALAVLHPQCEGTMELDAEAAALFKRWKRAKACEKKNEARLDSLKTSLLTILGDNQFGILPDGKVVKRFRVEKKGGPVSYVAKPGLDHYFKEVKGVK
jgi:putative phage-type endonuclease